MNGDVSMAILLTGPPASGKTTAVRRIAEALDPTAIAGFYATEIRRNGRREGFGIEVIGTHESGILASPDIQGSPRFGSILPNGQRRLGVSLEFLEKIACRRIADSKDSARLILIDEIGPMQACSSVFMSTINMLLDEERPLLASIAESDEPWLVHLRKDTRVAVIALSHSNRNIVTNALTMYVSELLAIDCVGRPLFQSSSKGLR